MKIDEREKFLIHFQVLIFQITINRFCAFCTLHDSDIAVIINGCLEELDPVVMALQKEIQSGNLPRDHIFYKVLNNALQFALKSGDPKEQFSHDKDVVLFSETLAFHGKDKIMNLLRGPGFKGQKKGGKYDFRWKDWNLPFVPSK